MSGTTAGRGLHRDRLTGSLYATFITWGWFLYGFSPAVPLIAAEQGISRAQAGLHGTALAGGTVVAGLLSAGVAVRFGRKVQSIAGYGLVVAGVLGLLAGQSLPATLLACFVTAVGGNFAISAAQPALSLHHGPNGAAAVTEGNAMGSSVGLLAPLAVGGSVALGWGWRPAVAIAIVLAVVSALLVGTLRSDGAMGRGAAAPRRPQATEPTADDDADDRPGRRRTARAGRNRFSGAFWFFWAAMLTGVAIEFSTTFWAADLLTSRTGAPPSLATASVSALVLGMSVARFILGPLAMRKSPEKLLLVAYAVAGVGFVVVWTATSPWVAVAGLVLAGLGYGAHYPLAVSLALRASDGRPDQAQARATVGTGFAVALAPFLLGALADAFGPHTAFLLVPVLIVVGASAVALGLRSVLRALHAAR